MSSRKLGKEDPAYTHLQPLQEFIRCNLKQCCKELIQFENGTRLGSRSMILAAQKVLAESPFYCRLSPTIHRSMVIDEIRTQALQFVIDGP